MNALVKFANTIMKVYLATPPPLRWLLWLVPIVYFLVPFDLDRLGVLGRFDDILLLIFCFWAFDRAGNFKDFFKETREFRKAQKGNMGNASEETFQEPLFGKTPHEILGLARDASSGDVKKAYRKLISMYHPDKFSHLGKEFEITAQRRTQAIIAAYKELIK